MTDRTADTSAATTARGSSSIGTRARLLREASTCRFRSSSELAIWLYAVAELRIVAARRRAARAISSDAKVVGQAAVKTMARIAAHADGADDHEDGHQVRVHLAQHGLGEQQRTDRSMRIGGRTATQQARRRRAARARCEAPPRLAWEAALPELRR